MDKLFIKYREKILVFIGSLGFVFWAIAAIAVVGFSEKHSVEKITIPFEVESRKSNFISRGWKIWLKEGKNGYKNAYKIKRSIFGINLRDKLVYESGELEKPIKGFVVKGASKTKHPITVPKETFVHYAHKMEATAYDPSPESNSIEWAGITCLGWRTRFGIAAVDPKVISLRSLVYVDGYGFAWAGDVGGAIKGKRIDLCYNTTEEALRWGRRKVKVYVLGRRPLSYYAKKRKR